MPERKVGLMRSGWSGVSDNSSTDSECTVLEVSSVASDQDRFDTVYEAFRPLSAELYDIDTTRHSRGVTSEDTPGVKLTDGQEKLRDVTHYHKVRRLHLIVVDLWRPWKYNASRAREITDQLWRISDGDDTRRVSPFRPAGPAPPLRCRRFAYGHALDGSECPCYLVWPQRNGRSYSLLDTSTADTLTLDRSYFRPLGMHHFYDSFALVSQICVRQEALTLFGLGDDELLPDLHITAAGVLRIGLGAHQEHRVNHVARAADRTRFPADVIQLAAHEVDPEPDQAESSGGTSDSDGSESDSDSEQNDPPTSLASDAEQYELMQVAYTPETGACP